MIVPLEALRAVSYLDVDSLGGRVFNGNGIPLLKRCQNKLWRHAE